MSRSRRLLASATQDVRSSTTLNATAINRAYLHRGRVDPFRGGGGRGVWDGRDTGAAATAVILSGRCIAASHKSLLAITDAG